MQFSFNPFSHLFSFFLYITAAFIDNVVKWVHHLDVYLGLGCDSVYNPSHLYFAFYKSYFIPVSFQALLLFLVLFRGCLMLLCLFCVVFGIIRRLLVLLFVSFTF